MSSPVPVKEITEGLIKPFADLIQKLCGHAFDQYGLVWADSVAAWRVQRAARLWGRVKEACEHAGIDPKPVKLSLLKGIVEAATIEDDDSLQDIWANLLANAADPRGEALVTTAFPEILKQISKEEAEYLKELEEINRKADAYTLVDFALEEETPSKLAPIYLDNLLRLRLIETSEYIPLAATGASREELRSGTKHQHERLTTEIHTLTALGKAFLSACTTPKQGS